MLSLIICPWLFDTVSYKHSSCLLIVFHNSFVINNVEFIIAEKLLKATFETHFPNVALLCEVLCSVPNRLW